MRINLHVYMHEPGEDILGDKLDEMLALLRFIYERGEQLMATSDEILAKVAEQATLIESVRALIAELRANAGDPVKMQEILDALDKNDAALAVALVTPGPAPEPNPT